MRVTGCTVRVTAGQYDWACAVNQDDRPVTGTPQELVTNEIARKIYLGNQFSL